jgi:hypothetical protein
MSTPLRRNRFFEGHSLCGIFKNFKVMPKRVGFLVFHELENARRTLRPGGYGVVATQSQQD